MNLFLRELYSYRKALFFWSLGMVGLVSSGMAKFSALTGSGQSISDLMNQLPRAVQMVFGVSGFDLSKASDYYGLLFIYIALMATVHAVLLGSDITAKEERDKTSEFLYVKPISRGHILTAKIGAGLANVLVLSGVTLVSSIYFVRELGKTDSVSHEVIILTGGLVFLQLTFFFIGIACAAYTTKPKLAATLATSTLLATFIISFLVNINEKLEPLKYLTPFKYFDAKTILQDGQVSPVSVTVALLFIIALTVSSYRAFSKRDLSV